MEGLRRSIWSRIFLKGDRLRPTWRVIVYILILLLTIWILGMLLGLLWGTFRPPKELFMPLMMLAYLADVLLVTYLARYFLDGRPLRDLGLRHYPGWLTDVAVGAGLGALLISLVFLAELAGGWLEVRGFAWQNGMKPNLLLGLGIAFFDFAVVGINEELIARGYILQNLAEEWGMTVAVVSSSVLFSLAHLGNPHSDLESTINLIVAGILFASGYLVTRSLWLPIALHFSWNFFQGPIVGYPVSGTSLGPRLLRTSVRGPELITGGAFGPEGGLIGLGVTFLGIALLWLWGRISKRIDEEGHRMLPARLRKRGL